MNGIDPILFSFTFDVTDDVAGDRGDGESPRRDARMRIILDHIGPGRNWADIL
jgi:hypothetical protein